MFDIGRKQQVNERCSLRHWRQCHSRRWSWKTQIDYLPRYYSTCAFGVPDSLYRPSWCRDRQRQKAALMDELEERGQEEMDVWLLGNGEGATKATASGRQWPYASKVRGKAMWTTSKKKLDWELRAVLEDEEVQTFDCGQPHLVVSLGMVEIRACQTCGVLALTVN